jgi:hypothetical protein
MPFHAVLKAKSLLLEIDRKGTMNEAKWLLFPSASELSYYATLHENNCFIYGN